MKKSVTTTELEQQAKRLIMRDGLVNVQLADVCIVSGIPFGSLTARTGKSFTQFMLDIAAQGYYGPMCKLRKKRVDPEIMRLHIMTVALHMCKKQHFRTLRRSAVAELAGTSEANIKRLYTTPEKFGDAVLRAAKIRNDETVLAQVKERTK